MEQLKSAVSTMTSATDGAARREVEEAKRTCLLILGMHRSGTSALTRTLSLLGAALPASLLGQDGSGAESNPLGHWEPEKVVALNDDALQSAGTRWRTPFGVEPGWYATREGGEFRARAVDLLAREYGASKLFVLKDPRTCLLAPLWLGALEDAGVTPAPVHVYRSPAEVAASLHKRNEIDPALSELLWLRYVLSAEHATRGYARAHLSYDSLLGDWAGTSARLADALGLEWPVAPSIAAAAVDAFIAPSARHHVDGHSSKSVGYVDQVYAQMRRWSDEGEARDDWQALDEARERLDRSVQMLPGPLTAAFDLSAMTAKLRKIRGGLDAEVGTLRSSKVALESRVGELEGALAQAEAARRKDEIELAEARTAGEILEREWTSRIAGLEALIAVLRESADAATARAVRLEAGQQENQAALLESIKRAAHFAERFGTSRTRLGQAETRAKELEYALENERRLREALERAAAARQQEMDALLRSDGRRSAVEEELGRALDERAHARAAMAQLTAQAGEANDRAREAAEALAGMRSRLQAAETARKAVASERDKMALTLANASKVGEERASLAKKLSKAAAAEKELRSAVLVLEEKVEEGVRLAKERQAAIKHLRQARAAAVAKRDARIESLSASIRALEAAHVRSTGGLSLGKRIRRLLGTVTGGRRREQDAAIRTAVEESGLFDVAYYLRRYPDVAAEGGDPLDHYLRHGGLEGRGPSALFSGKFYLEQNPDVRAAGVNPLVHYIMYGKAEGRRAQPDFAALPTRHGVAKHGARSSLPSPLIPSAAPQSAKRGVAISRPPDPALPAPAPFIWSARSPNYAALADVVAPWCKTVELPAEGALFVRSSVVAIAPAQGASAPRAAIDWLAYLSDGEPRPATRPEEAVRTALCAGDVAIDDIWFENDTLLHFRFSCAGRSPDNRHYGARLFQVDEADGLVILGESVFATPGLQRLAASVASHFRPILVVVTDDAGSYRDAMLLAFPSLCRSGAHFAELAAAYAEATPIESLEVYSAALLAKMDPAAGHAVSHLQIELAAAIGSEPLLQPALLGWLKELGIAVTGRVGGDAASLAQAALAEQIRAAVGEAAAARSGEGTLVVPADCIPSLSILFAPPEPAEDDARVTVIGTGTLAAEPTYALSVPVGYGMGFATENVLPYVLGPGGSAQGLGARALALRPMRLLDSQDPRRLVPVPMDVQHPLLRSGTEPVPISIILNCDAADDSGLLACLEGVMAQTGAELCEFLLVGDGRDLAAAMIARTAAAACVKVSMPSASGPATPAVLTEAARSAASENLLFLHHGVVLSDHRTIAALASILHQESVFAAGCALASDLTGPRGRPVERLVSGYLALRAGQVAEVDLSHITLPLLFPVAAPCPRLHLVRRTPWIETVEKIAVGFELDAFHLSVGREAIKAGGRNLSTLSLTAFDSLGAIGENVLAADVGGDQATAIRLLRQ